MLMKHVSLQRDDIQDFDKRWDQAPVSCNGHTQVESLYKMKIRESVQLQTALAMYDQEIDRDRAVPSYQGLKTIHIDQMVLSRNFKGRNERIETGVLLKTQKGKNASVERKSGECYEWQAKGRCSRGDACSFRHGKGRGQQAQIVLFDRKISRGESPSGR